MVLISIVVTVVILFIIIWYWLKHNDDVSGREFAKRNLKYVKISNLFKSILTKERIELLKTEAIKREGSVFGFNMLNKYTVMLTEPEIIQTILNKEFTNFTNKRVS